MFVPLVLFVSVVNFAVVIVVGLFKLSLNVPEKEKLAAPLPAAPSVTM